jgi:hypothetical protein
MSSDGRLTPWIAQWLAAPDALARDEVIELRLGLLGRCPRGHVVRRTLRGALVPHDVEGMEPVGKGYWSGNNVEGVGHLRCQEGTS